jgi:hypothetical protein
MHKLTLILLLAALLIAPQVGHTQDDRIFIDHIDVSKYGKNGRVRFYLDILDGRNRVIKDQDLKKISFFYNEELIVADDIDKVELSQFRYIDEPLAVGILITNYKGFINKNQGEINLFKYVKEGTISFLQGLQKDFDWAGVWLYNERGLENLQPFSKSTDGAIDSVRGVSEQGIVSEGEEKQQDIAPDFYGHIGTVVSAMEDQDELPRRRILLIISDAKGRQGLRTSRQIIEDRILSTVETAGEGRIKIYALGAYLHYEVGL